MSEPAGGGGRRGPSELALRVGSSVLLVPLALGLVWVGGWPFALAAAACALLLLREWIVIVGARRDRSLVGAAFAGVLAALLVVKTVGVEPALAVLAVTAAGAWLGGRLAARAAAGWLAGGILYAGLTGVVLVVVREGEHGAMLILFLFLTVWVTDTAAYFVGRRVGGPKLWRRVSPGKTWSGAVGGFVAAVGVGYVCGLLAGFGAPAAWMMAAGVLSVFSQAGDLFESAVKRRFGVKDSGRLIPGHGGVMDRIDGVVGAAVLGYAVVVVAGGGFVQPAALFAPPVLAVKGP